MTRIVFSAMMLLGAGMAQTPAPSRFVGTVSAIKVETAEFVIKPDNAAPVTVKLAADTVAERVEPGAKDLKTAQAMKVSDIAVGDRVLVVLLPDSTVIRRIVDMSAVDITKRDEADRADWNKRGISGVVAAKSGNEITLKMRSLQSEIRTTVTVTDKTKYRRYTADSVKFADAKVSKAEEISIGDQLRTRGQKSEDGLKVTAEDVVFGTFLTKAGAITAVNAETKEITVKELGTNKPLVVKLTADSQIKRMPNLAGMPGGPGGAPGGPGGGTWTNSVGPGGAPAGPGGKAPAGAPAGAPGGSPGGKAPAGAAAGAPSGGPGGPVMMTRPGGAAPDIGQMIERMPTAKIEDLKPGETIVVVSTKGAKDDEITAITLLSNAGGLIQMATMMSAGAARPAGMGGAGPSLSGLAMDIPAIMP